VRTVRSASGLVPEVVIVLGSGLGAIADELDGAVSIPYADIPHFHAPGVAGHPGRLVLGHLQGVPALVLQGRFHYYEGHPMGGRGWVWGWIAGLEGRWAWRGACGRVATPADRDGAVFSPRLKPRDPPRPPGHPPPP
jgi:hypothetical protein